MGVQLLPNTGSTQLLLLFWSSLVQIHSLMLRYATPPLSFPADFSKNAPAVVSIVKRGYEIHCHSQRAEGMRDEK